MSTQWGPVIGTMDPPSEANSPVAKRKPFFKRKQFLIAGMILAAIFGYLIYSGVMSAGMYYMTVSELMAQRNMVGTDQVRVQGKVVADSVKQDPSGQTIRFTISDGQQSLPVVYTGVVPDGFEPEAEAILEGTLSPEGTFAAVSLKTKCASKYNPLE